MSDVSASSSSKRQALFVLSPMLGERDAGEDVEALNHTESTLALVGH